MAVTRRARKLSDPLMVCEQSGERRVQQEMGSTTRANRFYESQMCESLNERMIELIERQEMVFVSTADAAGNCDCSPRFGSPGFVRVLDEATLTYPEFRGNGVYASLGNMLENPHAGLLFLDVFDSTVGLHVNGRARTARGDELPHQLQALSTETESRETVIPIEAWVIITVDEAYIHCSKHVPRLQKLPKPIDWGTDDPVAKSSDFFVEGESGERKECHAELCLHPD